MKKLIHYIKQWDKILHFVAGVWLGTVGFLLSMTLIEVKIISFLIGICLALFIGIVKEVKDKKFDYIDLYFTVAGGLFASLFFLIFYSHE